MKSKIMINFLLLSFSVSAGTFSFSDIIENLNSHESVEFLMRKANSKKEEASIKGSWGDPKFKLAAKNFPKDSLDDDQTPMTGIEFALSQKIALTGKYGNIENGFVSLSNALKFKADDQKEFLSKSLWDIVIVRRQILEEIKIVNENLNWITKILKVSKKLYANGKASQQAVLDIQIRKSELESSLSNKKYDIMQIEDKLSYLLKNDEDKLDYATIPWGILDIKQQKSKDFKELIFKENLAAKEYALTASKLNYIPDVTVAVGYTTRSNIDGNGDFIGASITFPLPFSGQKYANHRKAIQDKYSAVKEYENFKRTKKRNSSVLIKEIEKLNAEILILVERTIKYAKNSRTITSKSYSLGNSSYVEFLQSELKLQKILLKKVMLVAKRDMKKITLRYILGEPFYE